MADTKNPGDKTLSVGSKTLSLKPRTETGVVRQSFSHGRTKQVVVEKRGKRRVGGDGPATPEAHAPEPVIAKAAPAKAPLARPPAAPAHRARSTGRHQRAVCPPACRRASSVRERSASASRPSAVARSPIST